MRTVRIAMWSGPRNISTAMMRSFENRPDTGVSDEPFYAAYLDATGLDHPMRDEILASQPRDWSTVAETLKGPAPGGQPIWYQKHMTHHMLPGVGRDWMEGVVNAFLIRPPAAVLASYVEKRAEVTLADLGIPQQVEIFDRVADYLGHAPPVIEASDVLRDPRRTLQRLCAACGISFDERMLSWTAGRRPSDGVWAPAWYDKVERSTGFAPPRADLEAAALPRRLRSIADAGQSLYDRLAPHRL